MGMTKTQEELSLKLYHDTQTLVNDYIEKMSKEASCDKGLNLDDFRKISVALKTTIDTVYIATMKGMCTSIGEEIKRQDVAEALLVDILSEGLDSHMGEIMPMVVGKGLSSVVILKTMDSRVNDIESRRINVEEIKQKHFHLDPGASFEDIMEAASAKKPH